MFECLMGYPPFMASDPHTSFRKISNYKKYLVRQRQRRAAVRCVGFPVITPFLADLPQGHKPLRRREGPHSVAGAPAHALSPERRAAMTPSARPPARRPGRMQITDKEQRLGFEQIKAHPFFRVRAGARAACVPAPRLQVHALLTARRVGR
jgi:hypothetical protein